MGSVNSIDKILYQHEPALLLHLGPGHQLHEQPQCYASSSSLLSCDSGEDLAEVGMLETYQQGRDKVRTRFTWFPTVLENREF